MTLNKLHPSQLRAVSKQSIAACLLGIIITAGGVSIYHWDHPLPFTLDFYSLPFFISAWIPLFPWIVMFGVVALLAYKFWRKLFPFLFGLFIGIVLHYISFGIFATVLWLPAYL